MSNQSIKAIDVIREVKNTSLTLLKVLAFGGYSTMFTFNKK
ncbi:hypothetical protein [Pseudotamlana carrageenivorans]|nr:hypothetical protein [Tamlana carrageenivorans]